MRSFAAAAPAPSSRAGRPAVTDPVVLTYNGGLYVLGGTSPAVARDQLTGSRG